VQAGTHSRPTASRHRLLAAGAPTWCRAMALGPASRLAKGSTNSASGRRDSMARAAARAARTEKVQGVWHVLSVCDKRGEAVTHKLQYMGVCQGNAACCCAPAISRELNDTTPAA
jgi:hypothetical protein